MNLYENSGKLILEHITDFDLAQTLECGQCFRYTKVNEYHYILIAKNKVLELEQVNDTIIFYNTTKSDYEQIWKDYFDLDTDYKSIKEFLIQNDKKMNDIIPIGAGIRLLNQDFVETLISFIISQNKQIPQIKQVIEKICSKYGNPIGNYRGTLYYSFPTIENLCTITEENFKECKAGFRAKYLVDACAKLADGSIQEVDFNNCTADEIREKLCTIKGVGIKVSNCVLLYGLRQKEAFPVDVWIKRIMENLYFQKETKLEIIQHFAENKFGKYGGYAQQYLFYYARNIS